MTILFRKNRELEARIDEYLDLLIQGGLLFRQGLRLFLAHRMDEFEARVEELRQTERRGDELRRQIESELYRHTLIPESRGDVLGLLEGADQVLNVITATLVRFSVERPETLDDLNELFFDVAEQSCLAAESMVRSIHAYFRDPTATRESISKAQFHRAEANRLAERYTRTVFQRTLRLSHKNQLRYFAAHTERIAEDSEDVCDRVAIAAIKRDI